MKFLSPVLLVFLLTGCAKGEEKRYTGSTPANPVVKIFLGIPLPDFIDFIRWNLTFDEGKYSLQCNYGIGKPNTNGFINGGKKAVFEGPLIKEKNLYRLIHGNRLLHILELNDNLVHLMDDHKAMLIGGGGWAYTLSNTRPQVTDHVNMTTTVPAFRDSIVFIGRTPCKGIDNRPECYKLKWHIALYAGNNNDRSGDCLIRGTIYQHEYKKGTWKIIAGNEGRMIYRLQAEGKDPFYLLRIDDHVVLFTDAKGNPLVGDGDFSYTLSEKQ